MGSWRWVVRCCPATRQTNRSLAPSKLPTEVIDVLKAHKVGQGKDRLAAGELWQDTGLVFCSAVGTALDAANVRRQFRTVVAAAGIGGSWSPRELRHSFVSLMSARGVRIEEISRLVGHAGTTVTEKVYRHELRPVLTEGAEAMSGLFPGLGR